MYTPEMMAALSVDELNAMLVNPNIDNTPEQWAANAAAEREWDRREALLEAEEALAAEARDMRYAAWEAMVDHPLYGCHHFGCVHSKSP